jgi:hypothetical protein
MRVIAILILTSIIAFSCSNSKESTTAKNQEINKNEVPFAVIKEMPEVVPNVAINEMKIENGILHMNVSYSGGCEDQTFELIGSQMLMKSLPPKRTLTLLRNDHGDKCREWITQDLKFDLKPVMVDENPEKQVIFILSNNQKEIMLINESM